MGMNPRDRRFGGRRRPNRRQRRKIRRNQPKRVGRVQPGKQKPIPKRRRPPRRTFVPPGLGERAGAIGPAPRPGQETPESGDMEFIGTDPDGNEIWRDPITGEIEYREPGETGEEEEEETPFDNDLMAYVSDLLSQYGLDTPGLLEFTRNAIAQGWSQSQIMLELRRHPDYLANPLFAANVERAKNGGGWMAEGQLIAYANETKRLASQYGYGEPSDNYIAQNIAGGRSLAEFEHRVQIQRNVENYGPAVRMLMEDYLGHSFDDNDLYELFDPEIDTEEWSRAFKDAMYRGRPFALGLGVRSQAEADALRLLGVDPDEAFNRYSQMAQNAPRVERLGAIEELATGKLPDNFGDFMAKVPNGLQFRAFVGQDAAALAEIQALYSREIARHNQGGGAVSAQGQAIGLLSGIERASFG